MDQTTLWMNLKDIMLYKEKKPTLYDPIYMKWPEQANLQRQKVDWWLGRPGGRAGMRNDC